MQSSASRACRKRALSPDRLARMTSDCVCVCICPQVRRSLAANFGKFFHALQPEVQAEVQPHFTKLQKDDQDSVRILLLGSCLFACKAQSSACESWFYPAIEQFAKDDSWCGTLPLPVPRPLSLVPPG